MGSKQKITQASTLTPEQQALLGAKIRAAMSMSRGINVGQGWGGPNSYTPMNAATGAPAPQPATGTNPYADAIANATPPTIANNPFGLGAYSNRDALVKPLVNPFRRNLGG
jgi:hypothetical protein